MVYGDKRRSFTQFRRVINEAIKPLHVDHVDFKVIDGDPNYLKERQELYDAAHKKALERFPEQGNKLRYRGNPRDYFTNIVANAERKLRIGEIYTLKSLRLG